MTIIITGASGTIGRVAAVELAKLGCDCVCHYNKNHTQAKQMVEQITVLGSQAVAIQADLTNEKQIEDFWNRASNFNDKPKVLLNMAGIFHKAPLQDITSQKIDEIFDINFKVTALMCKGFASLLEKQKIAGKIINFTGVGGIRPWAQYSVYCASKAAVIALAKSLAKELAPDITVNVIVPGLIEWLPDDTEEFKKAQLEKIPLAKIGRSKDIVSAIKFLIENDYVTGAEINVDGGRSL